MHRVLCYGDSNTWGYTPGTGERFAADVRWTGVAQRRLGEDYLLIEEGMNGRTTVYDNPLSPWRSGGDFLPPCLISQKPLEWVALMLGTNDLQWTDAVGAAEGARRLIKLIRLASHLEESSPVFPHGPRILLISPIQVHASVQERDCIERWRGYYEQAQRFSALYARVAADMGVEFLDAALFASPSPIDGIHMPAQSHASLGRAIADKLLACR